LSVFVELVFVPVDSLDLNRDEPTSDTCTVRSGTNFCFVPAADVLFNFSRSGALSGDLAVDLDVVLLVVKGAVFFPVFDEDRRLKSERFYLFSYSASFDSKFCEKKKQIQSLDSITLMKSSNKEEKSDSYGILNFLFSLYLTFFLFIFSSRFHRELFDLY
jgi:hypothetical protein